MSLEVDNQRILPITKLVGIPIIQEVKIAPVSCLIIDIELVGDTPFAIEFDHMKSIEINT